MDEFHPTDAQRRFHEGGPRKIFRGGRGVADDHRLDAFRYMLFIQHYRRVERPSWLRPLKRIRWVHVHGPHVPFIREEIPSPFSRLRGVT